MKKYLIFLFLIIFAASTFASYISLNTTLVSKANDNQLRALVSSTNKGDESAHSVQAVLQTDGRTLRGEKITELPVGANYQAAFTIPLAKKLPGVYPLVLTMHYADANQYPFSALTAQTYTYKAEPPPAEIFGRIKGATFWKTGVITLTIKNMSDQELMVTAGLATPRELIAELGSRAVTIAPRAERHLDFKLENFSALSGSTYQLFAVLQFEKDGLHQTTIVTGLAKIVENRSLFGLDYPYLVIILVGLVLIVVLFQIFKK